MSMDKTPEELAAALRELAQRFSAGWHDGITIDATDIMDLNNAADALDELRAALRR